MITWEEAKRQVAAWGRNEAMTAHPAIEPQWREDADLFAEIVGATGGTISESYITVKWALSIDPSSVKASAMQIIGKARDIFVAAYAAKLALMREGKAE